MESRSSYERHLAEDLQRLSALVQGAVTEAGWHPHADGRMRILNLACGACDEATTLVTLAEAQGGILTQALEVKLTGVDIRITEIGHARERHRGTRFEFLVADASQLKGHRELGRDFDWVFLRHQNYWNGRLVWQRIFDTALELLSPTGLLMLTSYFDREHLLALEAIRAMGAQLVTSRVNPISRAMVTTGKSVDRHIAVFHKSKV